MKLFIQHRGQILVGIANFNSANQNTKTSKSSPLKNLQINDLCELLFRSRSFFRLLLFKEKNFFRPIVFFVAAVPRVTTGEPQPYCQYGIQFLYYLHGFDAVSYCSMGTFSANSQAGGSPGPLLTVLSFHKKRAQQVLVSSQ